MKRMTAILLAAILLISCFPLSALAATSDTAETAAGIEAKFRLLLEDLELKAYQHADDYFYAELAQYPEKNPEWVLIRGGLFDNDMPDGGFDYNYATFGNKLIRANVHSAPFRLSYGVYDVKSGAFYDLVDAWNMNLNNLRDVWDSLTITDPYSKDENGYECNMYMIGDADMDGDVTIVDATRIQRCLAELAVNPWEDFAETHAEFIRGAAIAGATDYDRDGDTTIMDATRIQRDLAELPNILSAKLVEDQETELIDDHTRSAAELLTDRKSLTDFAAKLTKQESSAKYDDAYFAAHALAGVYLRLSNIGFDITLDRAQIEADGTLALHFTASGELLSPMEEARYLLVELDNAFIDDIKDVKATVDEVFLSEPEFEYNVLWNKKYSAAGEGFELITEESQLDPTDYFHDQLIAYLDVHRYRSLDRYAYFLAKVPIGSTSYTLSVPEPVIDEDGILQLRVVVTGPEFGNCVANSRFICVQLTRDWVENSKDWNAELTFDCTDNKYGIYTAITAESRRKKASEVLKTSEFDVRYLEAPILTKVDGSQNKSVEIDNLEEKNNGYMLLLRSRKEFLHYFSAMDESGKYTDAFFRDSAILAVYGQGYNTGYEAKLNDIAVVRGTQLYADAGIVDPTPYLAAGETTPTVWTFRKVAQSDVGNVKTLSFWNSDSVTAEIVPEERLVNSGSIKYVTAPLETTPLDASAPAYYSFGWQDQEIPRVHTPLDASDTGYVLLIRNRSDFERYLPGFDKEKKYDDEYFKIYAVIAMLANGSGNENDRAELSDIAVSDAGEGDILFVRARYIHVEDPDHAYPPNDMIRWNLRQVRQSDVAGTKYIGFRKASEIVCSEFSEPYARPHISKITSGASSYLPLDAKPIAVSSPKTLEFGWNADYPEFTTPLEGSDTGYVLLIRNRAQFEEYLPGFDTNKVYGDDYFKSHAIIAVLAQGYEHEAEARIDNIAVIDGMTLYANPTVYGPGDSGPTAPVCWTFREVSQSDVSDVTQIRDWTTVTDFYIPYSGWEEYSPEGSYSSKPFLYIIREASQVESAIDAVCTGIDGGNYRGDHPFKIQAWNDKAAASYDMYALRVYQGSSDTSVFISSVRKKGDEVVVYLTRRLPNTPPAPDEHWKIFFFSVPKLYEELPVRIEVKDTLTTTPFTVRMTDEKKTDSVFGEALDFETLPTAAMSFSPYGGLDTQRFLSQPYQVSVIRTYEQYKSFLYDGSRTTDSKQHIFDTGGKEIDEGFFEENALIVGVGYFISAEEYLFFDEIRMEGGDIEVRFNRYTQADLYPDFDIAANIVGYCFAAAKAPQSAVSVLNDIRMLPEVKKLPQDFLFAQVSAPGDRQNLSEVAAAAESCSLLKSAGVDVTSKPSTLRYDVSWADFNIDCDLGRGVVMLIRSAEDFKKHFPSAYFDEEQRFNDAFFQKNALIAMVGTGEEDTFTCELCDPAVVDGSTLYIDAGGSYHPFYDGNGVQMDIPAAVYSWTFLKVAASDVAGIRAIRFWNTDSPTAQVDGSASGKPYIPGNDEVYSAVSGATFIPRKRLYHNKQGVINGFDDIREPDNAGGWAYYGREQSDYGYLYLIRNKQDFERYFPGYSLVGKNDDYFDAHAIIAYLAPSNVETDRANINCIAVQGNTLYVDAETSRYTRFNKTGNTIHEITSAWVTTCCWFVEVSQKDVKDVTEIRTWKTHSVGVPMWDVLISHTTRDSYDGFNLAKENVAIRATDRAELAAALDALYVDTDGNPIAHDDVIPDSLKENSKGKFTENVIALRVYRGSADTELEILPHKYDTTTGVLHIDVVRYVPAHPTTGDMYEIYILKLPELLSDEPIDVTTYTNTVPVPVDPAWAV